MRRPRMTISRWMTAVAIVAIALGVDGMGRRVGRMRPGPRFTVGRSGRRQRPYPARGRYAASRPIWSITGTDGISEASPFEETNELFDDMFASEQRRADYHGAMRRKYEHARPLPLALRGARSARPGMNSFVRND